ncbi:TRAP transporter substrate-binding protein DctP [bacterium]|nr:TRAP transporter substrate-binding protein DctP [bacterium]
MKRLAVVFLGLTILVATPLLAASISMKVATLSPEGTALAKAFHAANDEIKSATGGRVDLTLYPGGVQGSDTVVLRKMKVGQLHGATFTAGGISEVNRDFGIMSLPFQFRSYDEVDYVRPTIEPIIMKGIEDKGFVPVAMMEIGFVYMMSQQKINSVDDLKGRKVWQPEGDPVAKTVYAELGLSGVPLPLPDVLTGLRTGLVDTFANSPIGTVTLQWFTKAKYLTDYPLLYTYGTLVFSKRGWEKIPAQDRETVRGILKKHMDEINKGVRQSNAEAMATLKKQGIEVVAPNPEFVKRIEEVGDAATRKLAEQGMFSKDLEAKIDKLVAEYRAK